MLIHWVWLATRKAVPDWAKVRLLHHFQDAEDIFFADPQAYGAVAELSQDGMASLADKDLSQADQILRQCVDKRIDILTYRDAAYPNRLRNIADPPVVLYYKGHLRDLDSVPAIAVVGTRRCSGYGLTIAKRMGYQIAACGGIVVSGMAYGIDGMATRGALTGGSYAIGVLGSGVDVVYPASNASLFADMERYGCLLSEFPPGTEPVKWNFPKRNRIISGLCCGVLVVEAPAKSGALITAARAADQGRDVFVVPGNIDAISCEGSNALLRDGAIAVRDGWELLSEYQAQFPDKIHQAVGRTNQSIYPDELRKAAAEAEKSGPDGDNTDKKPPKTKKGIDNGPPKPYIDANKKRPALTAQEEQILHLIRQGKQTMDALIAETGMQAGQLTAALTLMEIKGVITRLPGQRVQLK